MYRNNRQNSSKIDPKTVPSSRHCIFLRGLPYSIGIDNVRSFFDGEFGGKCRVEFFKTTDDKKSLFLALRFDSHELARQVLEKYDNKRVLDHVVQITWFKDMRRARDERQYGGQNYDRPFQNSYRNRESSNNVNSRRRSGSGGGIGSGGNSGWRGNRDDRSNRSERYNSDHDLYGSSGGMLANGRNADGENYKFQNNRRRGISNERRSPNRTGSASCSRSPTRSSYSSFSSRSRSRSYSRSDRHFGSRDSPNGPSSPQNNSNNIQMNHSPQIEEGEDQDEEENLEPRAYRADRNVRKRDFQPLSEVKRKTEPVSNAKNGIKSNKCDYNSRSHSSASSSQMNSYVSVNRVNNEIIADNPNIRDTGHTNKLKRSAPSSKPDFNNVEVSSKKSKSESVDTSVVQVAPAETLQDKIKKKKLEIESAYKKDCETFSIVTKLLISKDRDLEESILGTLKDVLRELGQQCIQDLRVYIDKVIDKSLD